MTFITPKPNNRLDTVRQCVRVMIVDDSVVTRSILVRILSRSENVEVVVEAHDSKSALSALQQHDVDIILLDIEMPDRSGLDALPDLIEKSKGAGIIIVSSFAEQNGPAAIRALSLGACDTLAKPGRSGFTGMFSQTLIDKVIHLGQSKPRLVEHGIDRAKTSGIDVNCAPACIAIGASTGGIPAIFQIIENLDADITCPIFITQHLPETFMTFFARQLSGHTKRIVVVAEENMMVNQNHIYVAPGKSHLVCRSVNGQIQIGAASNYEASRYCPSVDAMLESVAAIYGAKAVGIVLSGMGQDGLAGARALSMAKGRIFAQDIDTSVVWGMPGAIVRENLATSVLNPLEIAAMLNNMASA
jgi:two-component system, chemotaxis family, protein-glutamate methylesterase/glutaminase